jgi:hypothetical protein
MVVSNFFFYKQGSIVSNDSSSNYPTRVNKSKSITNLTKQLNGQQSLHQVSSKHAFCNLCRRQFYSKSFLRNHMKKIHCIQMPDDEMETVTTTAASSAAQKLDPLSASGKFIDDEHKIDLDEEIGFESNYTNSVSTTAQSKFKQNAKLIGNGKSKMSTSGLPLISSNKLIKKKAFNLLNRNSLSANASLLNCMSTVRVSCNICNKELCNKYFLRQHVEKSHKISFNSYIEKYDGLNVDTHETNYKHNQNITHQLVRSILINHQNLLRVANASETNKNKSTFKKRILMKNRKLIRSFQQKKILSKIFFLSHIN